ncbi:unnamed protein product [Symbiodinium sp. CCMP2456]|nr:unnamed protein product [Symbiodinium sp. CCMP2456]
MAQTQNTLEIKGDIAHRLEANGALDQIRAQMRANFYCALLGEQDETNTPVEQEEEAPEAPQSMMSLVHDFLENWELSMTREVFLRETTVQPLRREDLVKEFASMTLDAPSGSEAVLEQVLASARRQRRSAVPEAIPEEQCR